MTGFRYKSFGILAGLLVIGAAGAGEPAAGADLRPYAATYEVVWHGITAGSVTYTFERLESGNWAYSSRSTPRGVAKMFLPDSITQRSVMQIGPDGVRPLSYDADDGSADGKRSTHLKFDWTAGRVRGTWEQTTVDLALRPGVQDDVSVQIALMQALVQGRVPSGFSVINKNSIRDYRYVHEAATTLDSAVGKLPVEIYRSEREKSPRQTRFWCAPSLGSLPLRAEQQRQGKVEWTMRIVSLQRTAQ